METHNPSIWDGTCAKLGTTGRVPKITASALPAGVSAQVPMAPDVVLRVGGHQVVVAEAPVAAGPEQVIPFLKHPCTLPASLAAYPCCRVTDHLSVCPGHRSASRLCIACQYARYWSVLVGIGVLVLAARCALRCAPMAARSLRHLIGDATVLSAPRLRFHERFGNGVRPRRRSRPEKVGAQAGSSCRSSDGARG